MLKQPAKSEPAEDIEYFEATRDDLLRALNDPSRVKTKLDIVAPLKVERVLDIGCGIGQALFPLAVSKNAYGIGVDIAGAALRIGREFYATHLPDAKVAFMQSKAESLPFDSACFDVVNCGLALPYTDNARAIAEVARVLRPGGLFLLKVHHMRYYLREFRRGVTSRNASSVIYGGRVLVAGIIYHLVRRQPRARFLNETFQTLWLLRRELMKHKLTIEREQPNSNPLTPAFVIHKAL
jgi:ubiquinone/menaquinone biosynthesis C-methylase UbiE